MRDRVPGGIIFFTVNLFGRRSDLLVRHRRTELSDEMMEVECAAHFRRALVPLNPSHAPTIDISAVIEDPLSL
jgi:hypothetical protein